MCVSIYDSGYRENCTGIVSLPEICRHNQNELRTDSVKEYQYKIRAHHGMCLAFFQGKGYSSEFTKHMAQMKRRLEENPLVCITGQTDVICSACPNNENGSCVTAEKVARYDRQVLKRCNLAEGQVMPFFDFEKLVYDNILLPGKRKEICGNCQWNCYCFFR